MFANPEDAFGGTTRLLALIETVYAAVEDPSLWPLILDTIAVAADGNQTFMFTDTGDPAIPQALIGSRTDPEALDMLVNHFAAINVFSEPAEAVFRDGDTRYSHWVVSDTDLERTEFYNDFFKPFDMHYSYGINVPVAGQSPVYISCQRPKCQPAFGEPEGLLLQILKPHISRAFTLHQKLVAAQSKMSGLETALDAFEHAVFGINHAGRIILSNRQAEAIAQAGDVLHVANGILSAVFSEQDRRLQELLSSSVAASAGLNLSSGGSLLLDSRSHKPPLRLTVTPFVSNMPGRSAQLAALVFVHDPSARPQSRAAILRALYGLTPTEARVADFLLQGLEVRETGNRLGITLETVRFNVKRVLAKTGTRRQAELIRLMLSLPTV